MKPRALSCLLLVGITLFVPKLAMTEIRIKDLSFRYGYSLKDDEFDQYDAAITVPLSWQKQYASGWLLHSNMEGILSLLTWSGDTAVKPSIMPNLVLTTPNKKVDFLAGLGLGVMIGDTEFGEDEDLGARSFFKAR